jgi:hypothetical protein
MKCGHRKLFAAAVTLAATLTGISARAQGNAGSPVVAPNANSSGSARPGTQGGFQPPSPIRPGQPVSVLVFPFGSPAAEAPAEAPMPADATAPPPETPAAAPAGRSSAEKEVDDTLTAAVKAGFLSTAAYAVATYHPLSSLVQRAKADEILTANMLTGIVATDTGAVDLDRAKNVTYRLGMQTFLLGTVELKQDAKAMSAEVTLQTQLIDSTTGEVLRSAAVSGAAAGAEGVPMSVVRERAALDAAAKVLPAMGIELVATAAPAAAPAAKGKSRPAKAAKKAEPKKEPRKPEPKKEEPKKSREKDDSSPKTASSRPERVARNVETPAPAEVTAQAAPEPSKTQAQPPTPPPADPGFSTPITSPVKGAANQAGQPVPYGYALGEVKSALPPRSRSGLKVPPWLGVAGFLAGISFLL